MLWMALKSESIMSTSEASAAGFPASSDSQNSTAVPVAVDLLPAAGGLPDLMAIARMANEFFSGLPVQAGPSPVLEPIPSAALARPVVSPESQPRAPASPAPTEAPLPPQEADFRSIPATLGGILGFAAPNLVSTPGAVPEPSPGSLYLVQDTPSTRGANPGSSSLAPSVPSVGGQSPVGQTSTTAVPASAAPFVPGESFEFVPDFATSNLVSAPSAVPEPSPGSLYLVQDTPGAHGAEPDFSSLAPSVPAGTDQGFARQPPAIANPTAVPASAAPFVPGESFEFAPELVPELNSTARPFEPRSIRGDFPILQEKVNGRPLIWLDNAATTQKPQAVIDRLSEFYEHENSNIHRAAHALAARASDAYEAARDKVRRFINAPSDREIVFVRGTTEGVNLVAKSWGGRNIEKGDEIVITWLEHHANIVPWQQLCSEKGARLRVAPVDDKGQIILEEYEKLFNSHTKIVSFSQVSNALGTITPAREMIEIAHRHGALVLLDGAQAVSHMRVDVQLLDCDFFVFSGHKVFGPTGIGAVFGKTAVLDSMPPWQSGGNMIADVTFERTVYNPPPWRFEAGTGNIADAVGLGAALDYVTKLGMENIEHYEHELLVYATKRLLTVPGLTIIGTAAEKAGVISFVLDGFRTEDVGAALDREGIAVRAGHHCAQPILRRFGLESTVRPSLAPYNTCEDIDVMVTTLRQLQANSGHRGL